MKTFKHSGTGGDLLYSLPLVKYLGGGEFYLHLNQIDWVGKHYYGSEPDPYHQGRMTQKDYEFFCDFMLAQDYITKFEMLDPKKQEITHNLDRFRPAFVNHPKNYVGVYCDAFGVTEQTLQDQISGTIWFTVPEVKLHENYNIVVNRTARGFSPKEVSPEWAAWRDQELNKCSLFVGLPNEHEAFQKWIGCSVDHCPTKTLLEVASVIAGAEQFIGNQSMCLALAQGLGVEYVFERRKDLPLERNESYFANHPQGSVF